MASASSWAAAATFDGPRRCLAAPECCGCRTPPEGRLSTATGVSRTPQLCDGSRRRGLFNRHNARMKHLAALAIAAVSAVALAAQAPTSPPAPQTNVPIIPFDSQTDFLKISPDQNLGEVLGIAVNSKGHVVVLNHPGSANAGPMYGNSSTQLMEFDQTGK